MKENLPANINNPAIDALVEAIREEILRGKEEVHNAIEEQKKLTYWNIGRHIKEHLLRNANKADYGEYLFIELSKSLNMSRTILYQTVQFFEEYPSIVRAPGRLTWTHLVILFKIKDIKKRKKYEKKIIEQNLSTRDLITMIRMDKGLPLLDSKTLPLAFSNGMPYSYKIKNIKNKDMIDLGFEICTELELQRKIYSIVGDLDIDEVVEVKKNKSKYTFVKSENRWYTYMAYLKEVIDGDTIIVDIDLGFKTWTTQKLRLRGINAEELGTTKGNAARDYIVSRLEACRFIAVKTYWRDKFKRYLADLFYYKDQQDIYKVAEKGAFLNQELLDKGLAVRY